MTMTLPCVLAALAVLFLVVELHVCSLHAGAIALGLAVAAVLAYFVPATSHLLVGGVLCLVSILAYFGLRSFIKTNRPVVMASSIGQMASIANVTPTGAFRVSYRGSEWDGVLEHGEGTSLKAGDFVRILGVQGIRLVVKPA